MAEIKQKIKGFVVWSICALFFLYEFFLRTIIGTYQQRIMDDLSLSSLEFSLLSTTIFLITYGLMQIPAGLIINSMGLKKAVAIGALLCALSCLGFAHSHIYSTALIARIIMGIGAAFGFICLLMAVYEWTSHKYRAIFIGISQFIGTLGPMFATGPMEHLSQVWNLDWRGIFIMLSILGAILTVLSIAFVEKNREKAAGYTIVSRSEKILTSFLKLFSKSQPWCIALVSACLYFAIEYLSENDGRAFLMLKGLEGAQAGYMFTIAWLGYAIGCPLLGGISDIFERRKPILTICGFLALFSIVLIIYLPNNGYFSVLFFILGVSAGGQSIGFATIAEQFKKQFVAVGFALNNAIITIVAGISASIIGYLLDCSKTNACISLVSYIQVFHLLIGFALISIIIAVFHIRETYCKSAVDFTVLSAKPCSKK